MHKIEMHRINWELEHRLEILPQTAKVSRQDNLETTLADFFIGSLIALFDSRLGIEYQAWFVDLHPVCTCLFQFAEKLQVSRQQVGKKRELVDVILAPLRANF